MKLRRIRIVYQGQVQGVGFRFNACQIAEGMQIAGFVRNEIDGTVLLEAQAERATLALFQQRIRDSRVGTFIRHEHVEKLPVLEDLSGFQLLR